MLWLGVLAAILTGTIAASVLSCLPALHIYNVAGILILFVLSVEAWLPLEVIFCFMMSLVVAYSILNTIPSIFLGAPDESAIFITMPGNRYLMLGKGCEASLLTGVGSLGGIAFLLAIAPAAPWLFPIIADVTKPHLHWILGAILGFMVMSEWPKGGDRGANGWDRFWQAWRNLIAGLATLVLSGILGFILLDRPVMPIAMSFQNIMPAFVGLFAVPWVIQNMVSRSEPSEQKIPDSLDLTSALFLRGVGAGGMGGLLAGHATAQRDDRLFIISQGASKTVYYVGAFLLIFVPGLGLTRGGMSWMMSGLGQPAGWGHYFLVLGAIGISGALSFLFLILFSKWTIRLIQKMDYRLVSWFTFALIVGIVGAMCGWEGLFVMSVASGIGMIPVFFHSRRMNCMGVLILPIMLKKAGYGPAVAGFLGLLG